MSVVDETVQDGVGIGWIADDLVPTVDRKLGCDHCGAASIALFEDFQEIVPCGGVRAAQAPNHRGSKGRLGRGCVRCADGAASPRASARSWEQTGRALVDDATDCRDRLCGQALRPTNFCRRPLDRRGPSCRGRRSTRPAAQLLEPQMTAGASDNRYPRRWPVGCSSAMPRRRIACHRRRRTHRERAEARRFHSRWPRPSAWQRNGMSSANAFLHANAWSRRADVEIDGGLSEQVVSPNCSSAVHGCWRARRSACRPWSVSASRDAGQGCCRGWMRTEP